MKPLFQKLLMIALMMAVLGYTFFNYLNGSTNILFLGMACLVIGYPLVHFISSLISDLRDR